MLVASPLVETRKNVFGAINEEKVINYRCFYDVFLMMFPFFFNVKRFSVR